VCIEFHMIIYMKSHVKNLWHINVHWILDDNLCEKLCEKINVHWISHENLCEKLCEKFLSLYYAREITWGAMWCVDF